LDKQSLATGAAGHFISTFAIGAIGRAVLVVVKAVVTEFNTHITFCRAHTANTGFIGCAWITVAARTLHRTIHATGLRFAAVGCTTVIVIAFQSCSRLTPGVVTHITHRACITVITRQTITFLGHNALTG